jgi:hypothetical protein
VVINGVPEPARIGFAPHVAPHLVELGAEPTTHLKLIRTPYLHFDLLRVINALLLFTIGDSLVSSTLA